MYFFFAGYRHRVARPAGPRTSSKFTLMPARSKWQLWKPIHDKAKLHSVYFYNSGVFCVVNLTTAFVPWRLLLLFGQIVVSCDTFQMFVPGNGQCQQGSLIVFVQVSLLCTSHRQWIFCRCKQHILMHIVFSVWQSVFSLLFSQNYGRNKLYQNVIWGFWTVVFSCSLSWTLCDVKLCLQYVCKVFSAVLQTCVQNWTERCKILSYFENHVEYLPMWSCCSFVETKKLVPSWFFDVFLLSTIMWRNKCFSVSCAKNAKQKCVLPRNSCRR